jgi:mono/diheme cytochrome c family protein
MATFYSFLEKEVDMKRQVVIIFLGAIFIFSVMGQAWGQAPKPPKKTPEIVAQGKTLFEQNCATCHGSKGDGKGQLGAALQPAPSDFAEPLKKWPNTKGDLQKIFGVISKGIPNSAMVKWDQLSEKERWALVYYVMSFSTPAKSTPSKKTK